MSSCIASKYRASKSDPQKHDEKKNCHLHPILPSSLESWSAVIAFPQSVCIYLIIHSSITSRGEFKVQEQQINFWRRYFKGSQCMIHHEIRPKLNHNVRASTVQYDRACTNAEVKTDRVDKLCRYEALRHRTSCEIIAWRHHLYMK